MTSMTQHQSRLLERMNAERKEIGLPPIPEYVPRTDSGNRDRWTDPQPTEKDDATR